MAGRPAIKSSNDTLTDVTEIAADGTATQVAFTDAIIVHSEVTTGTPIYALRELGDPEQAAGRRHREAVAMSISDAAKGAKVIERVIEQKAADPS